MTKLQQIRELCGLKQSEVSEKIGMSPTAYRAYETGQTIPSIDTAKKISEVFRINVLDVFDKDLGCGKWMTGKPEKEGIYVTTVMSKKFDCEHIHDIHVHTEENDITVKCCDTSICAGCRYNEQSNKKEYEIVIAYFKDGEFDIDIDITPRKVVAWMKSPLPCYFEE